LNDQKSDVEVSPLRLRYKGQKTEEVSKRGRVKIENNVPYICIFKKIRERIGEFLNYEIKVIKDPERPWGDWEVILVRPIREEEDKK